MQHRGFTLLELLVALAVLAVISLAIYDHSGNTIRQLHSMEERTLARWVAENEIAKLRLERLQQLTKKNLAAGAAARDNTASASSDRGAVPAGTHRQRIRQGDRTWQVVRETQATSDPALFRVEISVFAVEEGREVGPLDILTAFVGRY